MVGADIIRTINGMADRCHQKGQWRNIILLDKTTHLRKRHGDFGRHFIVILVAVVFGQMKCWHIVNVIFVRLLCFLQFDKPILVFGGLEIGFQRADAAVVFNGIAAQLQIVKQHAFDKFIEAAPIAGAVLVFQIDRVFFIPAAE